jgi:NADH-quinone oxidoreductase subunit B
MGVMDRVELPKPIKYVFNWGRKYSLWCFNFGLACCAIEFIAASTSRHDFIRHGVIPFAHGPRQADLLVVSGTLTDKMAPAVKRLYEEMPEPKYVISFGSCSNCGGPYWDSYSVTKGVDQVIPVDVYVPGCPPRPEALLDGIIALQDRIQGESLKERMAARRMTRSRSARMRRWRWRADVTDVLARRDEALSPDEIDRAAARSLRRRRRRHHDEFRRSRSTSRTDAWARCHALVPRRAAALAFDMFDCLFGVDAREEGFDVVAVLYSTSTGNRIALRTRCDGGRDAPTARRSPTSTAVRTGWSARPGTCSASSSTATPASSRAC